MPNTNPTDYGVVQFMPITTLAKLNPIEVLLSDDGPEHITGWPRVYDAILHGDMFVVETATPEFSATLHFSPERPDAGEYEIRHRPHGPIERGHTVRVLAIAENETDVTVSMLSPFATRYAIRTVANERPHNVLVWRVGLNNYKKDDEAAETDNGVA